MSLFSEELQQFEDYKPLLSSVDKIGPNQVAVVTLEGKQFTTELTNAGWRILDPNVDQSVISHCESPREIHYETVEALLMAQSPEFRNGWNNLLATKLNELAGVTQD